MVDIANALGLNVYVDFFEYKVEHLHTSLFHKWHNLPYHNHLTYYDSFLAN